MLIINVLINLILDNNLIFSIPKMQKDTLIVSTFRFAYKVLAVLNRSEKNLHSLINVVKSLDENELTMNAEAAACEFL
jgi:hypothetical protein